MSSRFFRLMTILGIAAVIAAGCGADDGATVTQIDGGVDDSASNSGDASTSASSSAPAGGTGGSTEGDGGYAYASDVASHRLVVLDSCAIAELLPADGDMDFSAAAEIYRNGLNSVNSDGSVRSIGGFAAADDRNPTHQAHYGSTTPIDDYITAALDGAGDFDGEPDAVRRQAVLKGIQNQTMVAWVVHELNAALEKAAAGDFDAAAGAPHNWDEGWAFYHGADAGCGPYATGDSRAANFGTLAADGQTGLANEALLAAMNNGRDALLAEDAAGAEAAAAEAVKNLAIIYSQATLRYAEVMDADLAEGDAEAARVHQAEGHAFFRVMEPFLAEAGADTDAINAVYELSNQPSTGGYAVIEAALQPAWDTLGITAADIGVLS